MRPAFSRNFTTLIRTSYRTKRLSLPLVQPMKTLTSYSSNKVFHEKLINTYFLPDIYRTNMFHLTSTGCALVLQKDLEYWGIDELMMEPCCALKYYPEIETCVNEKQVTQQYIALRLQIPTKSASRKWGYFEQR